MNPNWFRQWPGKNIKNRISLYAVFLFLTVYWLVLSLTERFAPPDFYKFYFVAHDLYGGALKTIIIPPLFPLLLYPLGKFLHLFTTAPVAFIWAGKLICLAAGLGTVYFTWRLLRCLDCRAAFSGVLLMALSPWFVKLLAFPTTDMLFLCFSSAVWYFSAITAAGVKRRIVLVGALATRFEGILLLPAALPNNFHPRRFRLMAVLATAALGIAVTFYYWFFTPRFFAHLLQVVSSKKVFLAFLLHPDQILHVFQANLFFFLPPTSSAWLSWLFSALLLLLLGIGIRTVWRFSHRLTLAMAGYSGIFLLVKGYIRWSDPEREFRRVLTPLWIIFILVFMGVYSLWQMLHRHIPANAARWPVFAVLCLCGILYLFNITHKKTLTYVISHANKAAVVTARWLNCNPLPVGSAILLYTDIPTTRYFLNPGTEARYHFHYADLTLPLRFTTERRDEFRKALRQELQQRKISRVVLDYWLVQDPEFVTVNEIKKFFFQERQNRSWLRFSRYLFFHGKNVGYVTKPVHDTANF